MTISEVETGTAAAASNEVDPTDVAAALRSAGVADVDISSRRRAEYSTDASNYRVVPAVVMFPRHADEVAAAVRVARLAGVPLTARGAGTSIAGNAVGTGIVVDFERHLNRVVSIDAEAATAHVQPGVILDALQAAAAPHGLRFGPDPSTHARCTIGGMIGNNACGSRALAYGRTADNVATLDVITADGTSFTARRYGRGASSVSGPEAPLIARLSEEIDAHLGLVRTEFGRFRRQVSGYSLEHLLPEHGFHLARALAGTEGSLAVMTAATVNLVRAPAATALAVLGYPDMAAAADAVPALLPFNPIALEGLDARIVDAIRRRRGSAAIPELPRGEGWLFAEMGAESARGGRGRGPRPRACVRRAGHGGVDRRARGRVVADPRGRRRAGRPFAVRDAGLARLGGRGCPARAARGLPARLLRPAGRARARDLGLRPLRRRMHSRPDRLPAGTRAQADARVRARGRGPGRGARRFDVRRARRRPRPRRTAAAHVLTWTPSSCRPGSRTCSTRSDVLNPGIIVRPVPLDADLRVPAAEPRRRHLAFAYPHDGGDFTTAVHRCVGVGKCRADTTADRRGHVPVLPGHAG